MPWISAKRLVPSSRWVLVSILCAGLVFVPGTAVAKSPCESETVIPDGLGYLRSTCEILWEFFSGLDDPGFLDDPDNPEAWGYGTPFLDWQGLGFQGGRLTVLALGSTGIRGTLSPVLSDLRDLTFLDLSANHLRGPIPEAIGGLEYLTDLNLHTNRLTGPVPEEVGGLQQLELLELGGNFLEGEIPSELGSLADLVLLSLHTNRLTGPVPVELGGLTKLEILALHTNQLSGPLPPELGRLSNLEYLDLGSNRLEGGLPVELGMLTNLTYLSLHSNELTGPIPAELGALSKLDALWLADNELTGPVPPELAHLVELPSTGTEETKPSESAALRFDPHGTPATKGFVAVEAYKWIRDNAADSIAGCDKTTDQFTDLDQDGVSKFEREAINCLASVGFFHNYPTPDDHADTLGEATPVTAGDAVPGVVDYPDDEDVFVFDAEEGNLYQIDVTLGTLEDSLLALYDTDHTLLALNDSYSGSLASRIFWKAPSSGRYYIAVASWGGYTGSYTLAVVASDIVDDYADTIGEATSVKVGGAVLGAVDYPGDIDVFVFDAEEGNLYQIDVALRTLGDSVAAVYDAYETELAVNDDYSGSLASRVSWEAPSSGRYYITVASWGDDTGSYTLTIIVR